MKFKVPVLYLAILLSFSTSFSQTPISGTWQILNNEPDNRLENAYTQIGDKFFYFGGLENKPSYHFDPTSNTWSQDPAGMPFNMHHLQAVSHEGLVFVASSWTGFNFAPNPISHVYIYDPLAAPNKRWLKGPEIPGSRRRGGAGAAVYNGKIYIAGGVNGGHGQGADSKEWFDVYDPQTGSWETLPDLPRVRDHYHAAVIGDKLYAAGGRDTGNPGYINDTYSEIDVYDFATGAWSTMTVELPQGRGGTMTVPVDSFLLVIGGETGQALAHTEVDLVDVNNEQWYAMPEMPVGRHGTQALIVGDKIYTAGGSSLNGIGTAILDQEVLNLSRPDTSENLLAPIEAGSLQSDVQNVHFGFAQPGDSLYEEVILAHAGGNQGIIIENISIIGDGDYKLKNTFRFPIVLGVAKELVLNITLEPNSAGPKTAEIQISHRGGNTLLPITLISTDDSTYNHPPKITSILDQASLLGDTISIQMEASDRDMDLVLFSALNLPPGLDIDPQTGLISGIVGLPAGTFETQIIATDQNTLSKSDTASFNWIITVPPNRPPFLRALRTQSYAQGDSIEIQLNATDPDLDVLTFESSILPDSLTLDAQTGLISGVLTADTGVYPIQVIVSDDAILALKDTIFFNFIVNEPPPNQAPIFGVLNDTTNMVGDSVSFFIQAWDPEGDSITYAAFGLPPGLMMDSLTGLIYGVISPNADIRNYAVIVQAYDNGTPMSAAGAKAFNWQVLPLSPTAPENPGQLPLIQPIANQQLEQGEDVNLFLSVQHFDPTPARVFISGLPQGLFFEPISRRITGQIEADTGSYPVIVYAISGFPIKRGERAFNFIISPPPNQAPVFSSIIPQSNYQGDTVELQLNAVDPEGDSLQYTSPNIGVLGLQLDSLSGLVSGIVAADTGQYMIEVVVSDNGSPIERDTLLVNWRVDFPPNAAPILDSVPNQMSEQWSIIELPITATDPDGDSLRFIANGLPTGLVIDNLTGVISGGIEDTVGVYEVNVQVEDVRPNFLTASISFLWEVAPATSILYRVNAGGIALNDSILGWEADKEATPSPYFASTQSNNTTGWDAFGGTNTTSAPDDLFGTNRWDGPWGDDMIWSFPVDQGIYEARLYFAENKSDIVAGDRVFDVTLEGEKVLENFDITAEVGVNTALEKAIQTNVTDGFLEIEFTKVAGTHPQINGIEIRRPGIQSQQARKATDPLGQQGLQSILVYPNPTTGELNIELPISNTREAGTISIYDMQGKLFLRTAFEANQGSKIRIDNLTLKEGLYLIVVNQDSYRYAPVRLVKW